MSLPSRWIPPVPEETTAVARAAFPNITAAVSEVE